MPKTTLEKLNDALRRIDRPGSFCSSGSVPAVLPGLEVKGLGPIGLPLTAQTAETLKTRCQQAPYGKGVKTLVDTNVRRVWRMEPRQFTIKNPQWQQFLDQTVKKVQEELGLEDQKLQAHIYDLLLYEPGSFFLPHRDGEKLDRMVATLVIVLPSSYEGGEIVVRHEGQEQTIDFTKVENSSFDIHFAAFYADCEHEIRPVRKGYRLCLVYNLTLGKTGKTITAPRISEHIERVRPLIREWTKDESQEKLCITLDHQYTKDGIAWDTLKGVDRVKTQVLEEAAHQESCRAYLALLTYHESGSAEYAGGYGYGRRRRRYDDYGEDDQDDGSNYEMGEIFETSLTAEHFIDSEGNGLPIGAMDIEEDEVLDSEALTEIEPEEDFEGYTGNAGMTLDRWYRHAAVFLWPERRHFEVLCSNGSRSAVPALEQMVAKWRRARGADAAALKAQCIEFAAAILAMWPEGRYSRTYHPSPEKSDLLKALAAIGEPALIHQYLGDVLLKDASADPGNSVAAIGQKYGWETFQPDLLAVMKGTTRETMERNVRLLEQISSAEPGKKAGWSELCEQLAHAIVPRIEAIDQSWNPTDWQARDVKRADVLDGLARSLLATGQCDLLSQFLSHVLALPKLYRLISAHVPALENLRPWLKSHVKKPCDGLTRWVAACREELESLTAQEPQEPADFRREAPIACKCRECAEMKQFLDDPREPEHRFSVAQERRNHLESQIRGDKLDVTSRTERRGRPYTLVCTKTMASYQEKLKEYHRNQKRLEAIRSIEAGLPG
jgi:hypothetical protein